MPIYEYRCSACGMEKEFLQKLSDPLLTTCPACGKETLAKKLTAAGFQLKGSGWYVTDFRNNGAAPSTKDANKDGKGGADKAADGTSGDSSAATEKAGGAKTEVKDSKSTGSTGNSSGSTSGTDSSSAGSSSSSSTSAGSASGSTG